MSATQAVNRLSHPSRQARHRARHADAAKIRLLQISDALRRGEGSTSASLARRFGVKQRTIERDIHLLKQAGMQVICDRKSHYYRIGRESFLPPVEFTPDEVLALLLLESHIGRDPVLQKPTRQALAKIRSQLPAAVGMQLNSLENRITVRPITGDAPGSDTDAYLKVQVAIQQGYELECVYEAAHSRTGENRRTFVLRPYHLLFSNRAWYVIGYCRNRKELRTLKLVRFEGIATTKRKFRIPADFSLADYLGKCWRLIPGKPQAQVRLHIAREFAAGLCETQWHSTQEAEFQPDGSAFMNFTVDGLDEIVWWILGLGPQCRVLEPPELAAKVRDLAARMAGVYAG